MEILPEWKNLVGVKFHYLIYRVRHFFTLILSEQKICGIFVFDLNLIQFQLKLDYAWIYTIKWVI